MKVFKQPTIPFKGFMVGNGVTNWKFDTDPGLPGTLYGFNMISTSNYMQLEKNGCVFYFDGSYDGPKECETYFEEAERMMRTLNPYDLFRYADGSAAEKNRGKGLLYKDYAPWHPRLKDDDRSLLPNVESLTSFLDQPEIRSALHIPE